MSEKVRYSIGILLFIAIVIVPFSSPIKQYLSIPNEITTLNNQSPIDLPQLGEEVSVTEEESLFAIDGDEFSPEVTGESDIVYDVAGVPIKKVNVDVHEDVKVIPGGQSVGVQLQTLGVLVVGHHLVKNNDGTSSPGEDAEVEVGDVITKINGKEIKKMEEVKPFVEKAGQNKEEMDLTIKRGEKTFTTTLEPAKDDKEEEFKIGLFIRDSAAGIGTISFYEPESKKYGALGHVISDMDTKKPIEINDGTIVESNVTSIEKGNNGNPGEKQAQFSIKENKIGNITRNSPFGIFGELEKDLKNGHYDEPMSIGLSNEVKEGPAKILTVIEGDKIEAFDVEVVNSVPQKHPATKGMVIEVTDKKLLEKTGGIVQGMSGSPIIQDDKVIGAITHVFVNDPTSGYGVHIEWMLEEAGVEVFPEKENKAG